ncbi:MAG: ABC transporter ATP-binding protein [Geodermatophilaceae bacterium]|nr:ABC transporter ATP-binding protein [Geodermatophilaceae bacterium]
MSTSTQTNPNPAAPTRVVVTDLSKRFGTVHAVDGLSFVVEPGQVTGFLGPNGAGKTTTLRMALGLITPDSGSATYGATPYAALSRPSSQVGAVLETAFHPGRSGRSHLRVYCAAAGIPDERADAVLAQVGMTDAAKRKTGGYSLGMRQRLGLATALLGDPQVLILDEPANGLDPEGIQWLRNFLQHLAHDQGRTILVSSHLLAEVQQTVDRIVIIAGGKLVREGTIAELADPARASVHLRSPNAAPLQQALIDAGAQVEMMRPGELTVRGMPIVAIGHLAFTSGVELHELRTANTDLEEIYFRLTAGQEEFKGAPNVPAGTPGAGPTEPSAATDAPAAQVRS